MIEIKSNKNQKRGAKENTHHPVPPFIYTPHLLPSIHDKLNLLPVYKTQITKETHKKSVLVLVNPTNRERRQDQTLTKMTLEGLDDQRSIGESQRLQRFSVLPNPESKASKVSACQRLASNGEGGERDDDSRE